MNQIVHEMAWAQYQTKQKQSHTIIKEIARHLLP